MIRELRLDRFKAFERFTLTLGKASFLVGPNNAGKSTLIGAVRFGAHLLRSANQWNPDRAATDGGTQYIAYGIDTARLGLPEPVMRHEFRQLETRLRLTFHDRGALTAVWPVTENDEDDDDPRAPFFYLRNGEGRQPHRAGEVRRWFPTVGVVPVLSPLDTTEELLSVDHVRANSDGRLASRHYRNHLWMLQNGDWPGLDSGAYQEFLDFVAEWTPEIVLHGVEPRDVMGKGRELDLWYTDRGRSAYKELCWVGDGIQIWLQILLQVFRLRESSTIVLDEPDVYLHADMQRRLVRLLESLAAQTITCDALSGSPR